MQRLERNSLETIVQVWGKVLVVLVAQSWYFATPGPAARQPPLSMGFPR